MIMVRMIFLASLIIVFLLGLSDAIAQNTGVLKTKDGRVFYFDNLQISGNSYLVRPRGLPQIEIPASDVKCINESCGRTPALPTTAVRVQGRIAIHGSNTIGAGLMPALIRKMAETMPATVDTRFGAKPEEQTIVIKPSSGQELSIDLASHGSGTSFEGLLSGVAQIGMSSRAIKPEEAAALNQRYGNDMLSPDSEHVIALDGLAVIVNNANALRNVAFTSETIAQVFAGEISDWSQLGGTPGPIQLFARDEKSGTRGTFDDLVMKPSKRKVALTAKTFESSEELSAEVAKAAGGIGFIGLPYIGDNQALAIGSTCGISHSPSRFTVQTEVYALARRLYLYTVGPPADALSQSVVAFAKSDEAQVVVRDQGFVDQTIEFEDSQLKARWLNDVAAATSKPPPQSKLRQMIELAQAATRASVNFRFQPGSANLDNKAYLDVGRLARLLREPRMVGKRWLLVGFADSDGGFAANEALSESRAQAVAGALRAQGVAVPDNAVAGLSWLGPVACNDTAAGKALNRRAELWIVH